MDAKTALTEAGGDMNQAVEILTRKGVAKSAERFGREAADGAIALAKGGAGEEAEQGGKSALAYISCETDFSAKAEDFVDCANRLAEAVLEEGPAAAEKFSSEIENLRTAKKENIEIQRVELIEAAPDSILDTYLHKQDGRGINGVIVEGSGVDLEALHQVSLHIAFAKPDFLSREEVPGEKIAEQKEIAIQRAKEQGKPEAALEKISEGMVTGWLKERVLLEQGLHGDKVKVADTLGGGSIIRFCQAYIR